MRLSIGTIVGMSLAAALAAACGDASISAPQPTGPAIAGPSFGRNPGAGPGNARGGGSGVGQTAINLSGGAHFALECTAFGACIYAPINAAARAIAPKGLDLNGVPIP